MDPDDRQKLNDIHQAIVGGLDGKPGIFTRLDRVERNQRLMSLIAAPGVGFLWDWIRNHLK